MKTITNKLKLALAVVGLLAIGTANAQQTTGDVTKQTGVNYGTTTTGGAIKVIDNKGTIKYLQVKNGITSLTNTTADVTTTTWQLGGALTDDTTITLGAQTFTLDGAEFRLASTETVGAAEVAATAAADATGYMLLARDQADGQVKRLLLSDLIQSVQQTVDVTDTTADLTFTTTFAASLNKIFVFRNGAKLRAGQDYTVAGTTVTLVPNTDSTNRNYWLLYTGDEIEYQYSK